MTRRARASLRTMTLDRLAIGDEASLRHVAIYAELKDVLRRARYRFRVLPAARAARPDRALLLNLTFWSADAGGDVLVAPRIEADVVAHAALHHLAARALPSARGRLPAAAALILGESIASAFDVYLVGRLLGHAPRSTFLATQTPAMADAAAAAGMTRAGFTALLASLAADPERAFADLRTLLYDASMALLSCKDSQQGLEALTALDGHRFAALLPRYELSNWVLYARAYADPRGSDRRAQGIDQALRRATSELAWIRERWIDPSLGHPPTRPRATPGTRPAARGAPAPKPARSQARARRAR